MTEDGELMVTCPKCQSEVDLSDIAPEINLDGKFAYLFYLPIFLNQAYFAGNSMVRHSYQIGIGKI